MNKWILSVLIPMIFLGILGSSKTSLALPNPTTIWLNPAFSSEVVGNDVSVDIMVSNVVNLRDWEFMLYYETNCLSAIEVTEGPFLKSLAGTYGTNFIVEEMNNAYNGTHGRLWAACFSIGKSSQPATESGVLATVEFRSTDTGVSQLAPGYRVKLTDWKGMEIQCTAAGADVLIAGPDTVPLDVTIDVGQLYFVEEQIEVYVMTNYHGVPVTPTHIEATLHNPYYETTSLELQLISKGFYVITYQMPYDEPWGTWAIVVEAAYLTDSIQAQRTAFKSFLISSALNSKLVSIEDTVAWIQTNVGLVRAELSSLRMHVTAIEGSTATIETMLGTLQGTITSINGNIATIRTDLGIVKLDISTIKSDTTPTVDWTTIGIYMSMALLMSIVIVLVVLYLYMRARFRSETV